MAGPARTTADLKSTGLPRRRSVEAHAAVEAWLRRARPVAAGATLQDENRVEPQVHFIKAGWACRARLLRDGRRQVMTLLLPGDHGGLKPELGGPSSTFCALSACEAASVPRREVTAAMADDPTLATALHLVEARQTARLEELVTSLGQRTALERTAHLFCELFERQSGEEAERCHLPLTQADLGDILGLSVVHVNRTINVLRRSGLVEVARRHLRVLDAQKLRTVAAFDPGYLDAGHLEAGRSTASAG